MTPAPEPPTYTPPERALVDLLGGSCGGLFFWRAALAAVELAIQRSRDREGGFLSYPEGELRRFLRDLEDALGLAVSAVVAQQLVNDGQTDGKEKDRRSDIAKVLLRRARAAARARGY